METKNTNEIRHVDVIVVGAGMSGIGCAAGLKQFGIHDFIVLEKGNTINHFWKNLTYDRVSLHSPWHDLPYDGGLVFQYPRYKNKHELTDYLIKYATKFNILNHIEYNKDVTNINIDDNNNKWIVTNNDGTVYTCNYLCLATSGYRKARIPQSLSSTMNNFNNGKDIFHSIHYKNGKNYKNKNVLVIGNGNSAFEICTDLVSYNAGKVCIISRSPRHVLSITDLNKKVYDFFTFAKYIGIIDKILLSQFMITEKHKDWDTNKLENDYFNKKMDEISLNLLKYNVPKPKQSPFVENLIHRNICVFDWENENSCVELIKSHRVKYINDEVIKFSKPNIIELKNNNNNNNINNNNTNVLKDINTVIIATGFYHGLDDLFNKEMYHKLFSKNASKYSYIPRRNVMMPITNGYCQSLIYKNLYFVTFSDVSKFGGLANGLWGWHCARDIAKQKGIYNKKNELSSWNKYTIAGMTAFILSASVTFTGIGYLSFKSYKSLTSLDSSKIFDALAAIQSEFIRIVKG